MNASRVALRYPSSYSLIPSGYWPSIGSCVFLSSSAASSSTLPGSLTSLLRGVSGNAVPPVNYRDGEHCGLFLPGGDGGVD